MSRRKKHQWVQVMTFNATDKQAAQAHAPDGPHRELLTADVLAAWVQCRVCEGEWSEVHDAFCPGSPTIAVPGPQDPGGG